MIRYREGRRLVGFNGQVSQKRPEARGESLGDGGVARHDLFQKRMAIDRDSHRNSEEEFGPFGPSARDRIDEKVVDRKLLLGGDVGGAVLKRWFECHAG